MGLPAKPPTMKPPPTSSLPQGSHPESKGETELDLTEDILDSAPALFLSVACVLYWCDLSSWFQPSRHCISGLLFVSPVLALLVLALSLAWVLHYRRRRAAYSCLGRVFNRLPFLFALGCFAVHLSLAAAVALSKHP